MEISISSVNINPVIQRQLKSHFDLMREHRREAHKDTKNKDMRRCHRCGKYDFITDMIREEYKTQTKYYCIDCDKRPRRRK